MSQVHEPTSRHGPVFWGSLVVGWAGIAFGVLSAWTHMGPPARTSFLLFFVGAAIVHDAVMAPIAIVVGVAVARRAPRLARAAIGGALIASAIVTLAAWPVVRRYGELPDNRSFLPNAAGLALLVILAGIWAVAAARIIRARKR